MILTFNRLGFSHTSIWERPSCFPYDKYKNSCAQGFLHTNFCCRRKYSNQNFWVPDSKRLLHGSSGSLIYGPALLLCVRFLFSLFLALLLWLPALLFLGGSHFKDFDLLSTKSYSFLKTPKLSIQTKSNQFLDCCLLFFQLYIVFY